MTGDGEPDLDRWISAPALRVAHHRASDVAADQLWAAAQAVRLSETTVLGRLVRWRIPGLAQDVRFDELFREPPFMVLESSEASLVSGLVGRIWTLRRDYPQLATAHEFDDWSQRGTARVIFATWVRSRPEGGAVIAVEARVQAIGGQGRIGVAAVRPLVRAFQHLIASEGIAAAARRAERA
ncbi:MAG: hypothetical protein ACRDNK_16240 [Solirubrobacteraceae bacterium]